jgi:hypothetical protein
MGDGCMSMDGFSRLVLSAEFHGKCQEQMECSVKYRGKKATQRRPLREEVSDQELKVSRA